MIGRVDASIGRVRFVFISLAIGSFLPGVEDDSERSEGPQDQTERRPGFAFFDLDDPLPAHANGRGERLLIELTAHSIVPDERP